MARENPIYEWPRADASTILLILGIIFGLLGLAVLLERRRRKRDQRLRLRAEWRVARQIADERELSAAEWKLLEHLIQRHYPDSPHKAVTMRRVFDEVVDKELKELATLKDEAVLEKHGVVLRDIRNRLGLTYIPFGQRINSTRELYLEQLLWAGADKESADWFRMTVGGVDEAHFHVIPHSRHLPPFQPGQIVTFRMWRDEDARYEFQATLLRAETVPPAFVFRHTSDLQRMQAREYFRLTYDQPVNIGVVNAPVDGDMRNVERRPVVTRLRGRVTSLSAGGAAVLVQQPVPRQVLLRLGLPLEDEAEPLEVTVRIIESLPLPGGQYRLRGAFVGLSDDDQERITHYIFRKQQQMMPAEAHLQHPVE